MIKNIEDLKDIQVVCKNDEDIEKYFEILKELGFEVILYNKYKVFYYSSFYNKFSNRMELDCYLKTYFFNKKFIKILQKFIKEKEEKGQAKEEEKVKDFEVASDGRVIKINNKESEKQIFVVYDEAYNYDYEYYKETGMKIVDMAQNYLNFIVKYGLAYETKEARDRALFKIEIETKLKNIAERLNKGQKIDWEDKGQEKFNIFYHYGCDEGLGYQISSCERDQGVIYCLNESFLKIAEKEIGKENLIKYFKE